MPAYFDSGFSVRKPMWHGMGDVLDEHPTDWADARAKAGLTWEPVELTPYALWPVLSFSCDTCHGHIGEKHLGPCGDGLAGQKIGDEVLPERSIVTEQGVFVPAADHKAIARPDTHRVLGVRSDEYSTIYHGRQNELGEEIGAGDGRASMEEIIEAFRGADGNLRFETAGSCRDGREVWALLYLDEPYRIPGDETTHLPFIAVLNRHAGGGCRVTATSVRVVCWNTFQAAEAQGDASGMTFTFRHVGDVAGRIEEAKASIAGLRDETAAYVEMATELTQLNVSDPTVDRFLTDFLPSPRENGEQCSDRVHGNVETARKLFKAIYFDSPTTDGIRGNGFGLLQTATEYLDHGRRYNSRDSYMGRTILRGEPLKARTLTLVRQHAAN